MDYKWIVQTVVETPTYLSAAEKLFSEDERADIVLTVAADPECGEVMKGTGGFRKFRVARGGKGKSGGARVIYIQRDNTVPVFLIGKYRFRRKSPKSMVPLSLTGITDRFPNRNARHSAEVSD